MTSHSQMSFQVQAAPTASRTWNDPKREFPSCLFSFLANCLPSPYLFHPKPSAFDLASRPEIDTTIIVSIDTLISTQKLTQLITSQKVTNNSNKKTPFKKTSNSHNNPMTESNAQPG